VALSFIASVGPLRYLALVAAIILSGLTAAGAQSQLSAEQTRVLAFQLLEAGNPEPASQLAKLLLQRDTDDLSALVVLARAETMLGNANAAARAWKRVFRLSPNPVEKFAMARKIAEAHFALAHLTRSQWWLRRAANLAPNAQAAQVVAREYKAVKAKNPFSAQLSFSLAPSSNINGGSSEEIFYFAGIPFILSPDALALSGYELATGANLKYRLGQSRTHLTSVGVNLSAREYALSDESKASAPMVRASDFALRVGEIYLEQRRSIFAGLGPSDMSVLVGQSWYGGDPLWRYNRLNVAQNFPIARNSAIDFRVFVEEQTALAAGLDNSVILDTQLSFTRALANRDRLKLVIGQRKNDAVVDTSDYTSRNASISYDFAKKLRGTSISLNFGLADKDYPIYGLSVGGRQDYSVLGGVTAVFDNVSKLGFSPSLSIDAKRTTSTVSRYSSENISARFGWQSNF
jgi:hypothetical protein